MWPWDVESLYEFQYFNCPTCPYKHHSAQDFVDHAFNSHPESKNYPDSFSDILPPWKYESKHSFINSMKNELNEYEESSKSVENSNLIDDDEEINIAKSEEYSDNWNTSFDVTNNVTNVTSEMTNGPNIVTNQEKVTSLGVGSKHSNAPNQNVHEEEKSFNKKEDIDTTLQFQNVHKGLKELSCKHCDKKYYAELALISHLKSAHNVFQDLQHVKKVHEGSKEFSIKKVHEVSKEFSPKQQGRAHPPDSRLRALTCKHCAKNFSTQLYFDKHMKTCPKNKKTDKNVALVRKSHNNFVVVLGYTKSKTCDDVDKKIISEIGTEMTTGNKNQEGQRNYKCDHCGKSFTHSGYLDNHINMVHEGQKDYNCKSCGKSFSQAGSLKRHIYNCESVKHKWQMAVHEELKSKT